MTEEEIAELINENAQLTLCLTQIDCIAQAMQKNPNIEIQELAMSIRLYSDEEQRQDGV